MKVAVFTTDNREHDRAYAETTPRFCAAADSLFQGFAGMPEIEVHVVSCTQQPMQSPAKLWPNVHYHSVVVPKIGWLRTLYQGCIRATRRKLAEIKPDLVHGMGTERDCSLCAVLSGLPNVVTIHGNVAELARLQQPRVGSYLWLAAKLENFTLRRTAGVLCNSTYTQGLARTRARRTWHAPHAFRTSFLETPQPSGSRPCALLIAGVVTPRKRQLELLEVAEQLRRQGLKFEFRFIGYIYSEADPYVVAFRKKLEALEAEGCAKFLGTVPESGLVECFDSVAAMVHFPTEEAFGNVVGEALARNLKFFGARLGGIVDIAGSAPGAELFERDDWSGLTESIARWIREGHPRPTEAAQYIRERYHPEAIARQHLQIYREVLGTNG